MPPWAALSKAYILQWLSFQRLSWKLKEQPSALKAALAVQLASRMGSTTQISIVGPAGNAVSLTATNGEGSGGSEKEKHLGSCRRPSPRWSGHRALIGYQYSIGQSRKSESGSRNSLR